MKKYAIGVGLQVAPHDMRRTFARLARRGHAALEQIQLSLGHSSVSTTEIYLGARQDLTDAPCDHLGLTFDDDSETGGASCVCGTPAAEPSDASVA